IDYLPPPRTGSKLPAAHVSASAGDVGRPTVQTNPQTGGGRVSLILRPNDAVSVELRLTLEEPNAEVWLYRWTRHCRALVRNWHKPVTVAIESTKQKGSRRAGEMSELENAAYWRNRAKEVRQAA